MSKRNILCMAGTTGAFENTLPEAIFGGAAKIGRKTAEPRFVEKFRIIMGLLMMFAGLYFGFFTAGASEGLGLLAVMASPFVMITDKG
jgi:hypothetical protein